MKLVKFSNGKYGVRRGWLFYVYKDFRDWEYWWHKTSKHFPDCMVSEEEARNYFVKDEVIPL